MQALLDAPNPSTVSGLRDRAMLHLAYAGGLRVGELIALRVDQFDMRAPCAIHVTGKGRRERMLPLWKKQYASGPSADQRTITKPEAGTVVVRVGGNPVSVDVDHLTGLVTFTSAPGSQPYADFLFDVPVRFDTDHLPVVAVAYHIQQVASIALVEVRA